MKFQKNIILVLIAFLAVQVYTQDFVEDGFIDGFDYFSSYDIAISSFPELFDYGYYYDYPGWSAFYECGTYFDGCCEPYSYSIFNDLFYYQCYSIYYRKNNDAKLKLRKNLPEFKEKLEKLVKKINPENKNMPLSEQLSKLKKEITGKENGSLEEFREKNKAYDSKSLQFQILRNKIIELEKYVETNKAETQTVESKK